MNYYCELHFKHCEKMFTGPKNAVKRYFRYNNVQNLKVNINMEFSSL